MATKAWVGGATAVAQIETFTLNDDWDDSETALTMTMTAEDGSTQTESVTPSGVDESVIAALWQAALSTSTQSLFTAVTWTVTTNVVTGTAKVAGVPFYAASSVTGGGGKGTVTDSESTSSVGPNDFNSGLNWTTSGVPASADEVHITDGTYDILYGLDQSAKDFNSLRIGPEFTGSIGNSANGYYLKCDVSNVGSSNVPFTRINSRAKAIWLEGVHDATHVIAGPNVPNMLRLNGTISSLRILGSGANGTITVADSARISDLKMINAGGVRVNVGESVVATGTWTINGGRFYTKSNVPTVNLINGDFTVDGADSSTSNTATTLNIYGGRMKYLAGGTVTTATVYGGSLEVGANIGASLTFTNTINVWGGTYSEVGGIGNIVYGSTTEKIINHGGTVHADVGKQVTIAKQ
jgi:hypothetical protein